MNVHGMELVLTIESTEGASLASRLAEVPKRIY